MRYLLIILVLTGCIRKELDEVSPITFYYPTDQYDQINDIKILINGNTEILALPKGSNRSIYLPYGEYDIVSDVMGIDNEPLKLIIYPNKEYYVKMWINKQPFDSSFNLTQTANPIKFGK